MGWDLLNQNYFECACKALGKALATKTNHQLVLANEAAETADMYVAQGFHVRAQDDGRIIATPQDGRPTGPAHIAAVAQADAVVIIGGAHGSYGAGLAALHTRKRLVPVKCFGGAAQRLLKEMPHATASINRLNRIKPAAGGWENELANAVIESLEAYPRILLIHGRSHDRQEVKRILVDMSARSGCNEFSKLPDPVILQERTSAAKTIPEIFEELAAEVDAAIAVVTPDDLGVTAFDDKGRPLHATDLSGFELRARENVWVEVGWFWGRLGRSKLMILKKGKRVKVPSDLGSAITHTYGESPDDCKAEILDFVRRLRSGLL